jgi:hypothetical protein
MFLFINIFFMKKVAVGFFHVSRLFVRLVLNKARFEAFVGFDGISFSIKERKKTETKGFDIGVE